MKTRFCYVICARRFRSKYHPEEYEKNHEELRAVLKERCDVFIKLLDMKLINGITVDGDQTTSLVKLLDQGTHTFTFVKSMVLYPDAGSLSAYIHRSSELDLETSMGQFSVKKQVWGKGYPKCCGFGEILNSNVIIFWVITHKT